MRHPRPVRRALAGALLVCAAVVASGSPPVGAAVPEATVLADTGISSPKGLSLDKQYQPLVTQGAFGAPGPLLRFRLVPPNAGTLEPVSPVVGATGVAYVRKTNTAWILGSDGKLYRQKRLGEAPQFVADLIAFAAANPDPDNGDDGPPEDSNPFGLTALPNGNAIVTDAAANSVLRVTPSGRISLVARLPREVVSTDHLDPAMGLPPTLPAEAVPTGVTIGPDGHIYVGELKGFPFRPGSSRIWRIEPNATGAVCSPGGPIKPKNCKLHRSGLASIASLAFDAAKALYVFEYSAQGVGAFEEGCMSLAGCPPAVLLKIAGGTTTELAPGELSEPGWLVTHGSTLHLTDQVLTGGRLLSIPIT